jgi:hypothetical protein
MTSVASKAFRHIDRQLDDFSRGHLTPRAVEQVLGISTRERLKWTKDGRLPRSGSASFRRGHDIHISLHPADKIAALAANPSIISAWRAADAEIVPAKG